MAGHGRRRRLSLRRIPVPPAPPLTVPPGSELSESSSFGSPNDTTSPMAATTNAARNVTVAPSATAWRTASPTSAGSWAICAGDCSSESASVPAGRAPAASRASATRTLNRPPSRATPSVEPILRVNWVTAVAAPRRVRSTAFWTATIVTGITRPIPRPAMPTYTAGRHGGVVVLIVTSRPAPTSSAAEPMMARRR